MKTRTQRILESDIGIDFDFVSDAVNTVKNVVSDAGDVVKDVGEGIGDAASAVAHVGQGAIDAFADAATSLEDKAADWASTGAHYAVLVLTPVIKVTKSLAELTDFPVIIAGNIPVIGGVIRTISPAEKWQTTATKIEAEDWNGLKNMVTSDLKTAQSVIALFPGIGTGISEVMGAGITALNGGHPLEFALRAAYSAIPIPPGIRTVTDLVLDTCLELAFHPASFTDLALQVARKQIPAGLPQDLFDSFVQVIIKKVPIQKVGFDKLMAMAKDKFPNIPEGDAIQKYGAEVGINVEEIAERGVMHAIDNIEGGEQFKAELRAQDRFKQAAKQLLHSKTGATKTVAHQTHQKLIGSFDVPIITTQKVSASSTAGSRIFLATNPVITPAPVMKPATYVEKPAAKPVAVPSSKVPMAIGGGLGAATAIAFGLGAPFVVGAGLMTALGTWLFKK